MRDRCAVCGLDLSHQDTGDGAAFAVILLLGGLVIWMAFWVEFHLSPPLWVHALIWPIFTVPVAILMMRPLKAALVGLQYRHRPMQPPQGDE